MTTLTRVLPAPVHKYVHESDLDDLPDEHSSSPTPVIASVLSSSMKPQIPRYLHRANFIPHKIEDFGDGGAFPEIHVAQYPLNMGRPGATSTAVVAVNVDEKGEVKYDAIVKQGSNRNKIVKTSLDDMKESTGDAIKLDLPSKEEEDSAADATRKALEALLDGKIRKAKPTGPTTAAANSEEPKYIRYTPNPNLPGSNPDAKARIIRMVEAQVDPMEPPKHRIKKVPRGGGSPPVPVLHSPPRSLTVKDQQAWKIPPCISNWKNARGYTIPLDKRLAADGRGLQDVTINNKFASLSESLYIAERKAAEDLRIRNQIRKRMAMKEKEDKEKELREMASQARMERAGILSGGAPAGDRYQEAPNHPESDDFGSDSESDVEDKSRGRDIRRRDSRSPSPRRRDSRSPSPRRRNSRSASPPRRRGSYHSDDSDRDRRRSSRDHSDDEDRSHRRRDNEDDGRRYGETDEEKTARLQRERLRIERRKERERELRLENMKGTMRKNKIDRDMNRDVSEKIALGMHKGSGQLTGEAMYDARLFNQSSGMDSGFGGEDEYNTYSRPLFDRQAADSIYRPKRDDSDIYGDVDTQMAKLNDTSRFKPDKGFKGAEGGVKGEGRSEPVQFEKVQADPFGIDDIVEGSSRKKARWD